MRVIGLDPGLRFTGWGVIEAEGNRLRHLGDGVITTVSTRPLGERLVALQEGIAAILEAYHPDQAAVETTLANKNPSSTLKLGMARGVALLTPTLRGLPVAEYLPMIVKKAVVGTGHAAKDQVAMMVKRLLPGATLERADAADALAVAICHAHHAQTALGWQTGARAAALREAGARP
ncbi:MAG: crossover junction endodeoxyribonuclease RuvC [Kiloniellales bacterium]